MTLTVKGVGERVLTNNNLVQLRIEEYAGVRLPIAKMIVNVDSNYLAELRLGQEIILSFETDSIVVDDITFDLIDIAETPTSEKNLIKITMSLVYKYYSLIKTQKQELYEATAVEVLAQYGFYDETKSTNDKQVYIRANLSEKAFYRQIIQQIYLGEQDCPISTVNLKEKRIKSLNKILNEDEPYIYLTKDATKGAELFTIISKGSSSTLTDYLYGADRVDSILKAEDNEVYYLDYKGKTIEDIEQYSEKTNLYLNPTKNDTCNCHKDYFKALIRNRTAWLALNTEKIIVRLSNEELRFDLPLIACAEILEDGMNVSDLEYVGKWVITGKYQALDKSLAATHLELSRIPKDYFRRVKDVS